MTGGMGGYSPAPWVSEEQWAEIAATVLWPTVAGMAAEGIPFSGFLYAGIMMTPPARKVLEYNVRLGDPEAQLLLPRLESDFADILLRHPGGAPARSRPGIRWSADATCAVVLASQGYPAQSLTGRVISGLGDLPDGRAGLPRGHAPARRRRQLGQPGETGAGRGAEMYDPLLDEKPDITASGVFRYLRVKSLPERLRVGQEDPMAALLAGGRWSTPAGAC